MDELLFSSATSLAKSIREKKISSSELVEAYLNRIEEVNPQLNCFVQFNEQARSQALQADAALARGEVMGPLHGVPMTTKDSIETAGVITTGGTLGWASHVPQEDAASIGRLRAAGAIMLGNTNVPEFCMSGESVNLIYGRSNNPYDLSCVPGGSSGGEAATIASGGSPAGLGSDGAGSIRWPAHCCGIAGLKPTAGRVPRTGHWPPLSGIGLLDPTFHVGPMARYVEDLALVLGVISGVDWRDVRAVPMPLGDPGNVDLKALRAAFFIDNGTRPVSEDTAKVIKSAAKALSDAGLSVEEAVPDGIGQNYDLFMDLYGADTGAGIRSLVDFAGTKETHPEFGKLMGLMPDEPLSAFEYSGLMVRWDEFRSKILRFMETYDVIVCPVYTGPAVPHGTFFDRFDNFSYTIVFNLTGWPSAVVRGGTSSGGLPIGVQVAAAPWREDVALAVAQHLESSMGGWKRPPI